MLVDTPYSMGCYKVHLDLQANPPSSTTMSDLSPAKCLFHCLTENSNQRYAGNGRRIFYRFELKVMHNMTQKITYKNIQYSYLTRIMEGK